MPPSLLQKRLWSLVVALQVIQSAAFVRSSAYLSHHAVKNGHPLFGSTFGFSTLWLFYNVGMTTLYMTTALAGINPATMSPPRVAGTTVKEQTIVPFGGSAPPVLDLDKEILGGKGLGLQEMSSIGIEVPPGFTLTTPLCQLFDQQGGFTEDLWNEIGDAIRLVEKDMGRKFGDAENPLLFSCRSGAAISMPGMMDTVLNVVSCRLSCMT
jgi:Pyruvate phosphate dikinase, AMP/ATP-binding domain